jgi:DNA-binding GntR family transcriptional regulator
MMNEMKDDQLTADPVYQALKSAIISGELAPGEPLRQDEIAKQHGISKIPVREALLRLEVDGFVLFRKNKGAIVRELSAQEVLNLLDIREALECKALELAVPLMIDSDLTAAREVIDAYGREQTVEAWSRLNVRFHQILYEPCGNAPLLQMIDDLRARIGPVMRLMVTETSGLDRPHAEHQAILQACIEHDAPKAAALLRQHIQTTRKETAAKLLRRGL